MKNFLHSLLMGDNSPVNLKPTLGLLQYIKEQNKVLGDKYDIELALDWNKIKDINEIFGISYIFDGYKDMRGTYKYINVLKTNYSYEKYEQEKDNLIDYEDRKKHKKWPHLSLFGIEEYLVRSILNEKRLTIYDVFIWQFVFYDSTFKLMFITFEKIYSSLSPEEIKIEYYKNYLSAELRKLEYDLGQFFEKENYTKHLDILKYYETKFKKLSTETNDSNNKECFNIIYNHVYDLRQNLLKFYGLKKSEPNETIKLVWTSSYEYFIDFFNELINEKAITFNEDNNRYIIYSILLEHIKVCKGKASGEVSIHDLLKDINLVKTSDVFDIKTDKLLWHKGGDYFAVKFSPLINFKNTKESILLFKGKSERNPIVEKLFDIFAIESIKYPGEIIECSSLITAFKTLPS